MKVDDPELLYVAALIHDLGATDPHFGKDSRAHCFAVEGGFAAEAFLSQEGLEPDKAERVAEAIILHINARVDAEHGVVAHYLSAGAWCDLQGHRALEIPNVAARRVLARYPDVAGAGSLLAILTSQRAGSLLAILTSPLRSPAS